MSNEPQPDNQYFADESYYQGLATEAQKTSNVFKHASQVTGGAALGVVTTGFITDSMNVGAGGALGFFMGGSLYMISRHSQIDANQWATAAEEAGPINPLDALHLHHLAGIDHTTEKRELLHTTGFVALVGGGTIATSLAIENNIPASETREAITGGVEALGIVITGIVAISGITTAYKWHRSARNYEEQAGDSVKKTFGLHVLPGINRLTARP